MSDELLNNAYRVSYWQKNELQLILCDFPSSIIQWEIDRHERLQSRIVEVLGYMPQA